MGKSEKNAESAQKTKVGIEQQLTRDEAIGYLECILTGLKQGTVTLENEERALTLSIPETLMLELELKQKGTGRKVEFELSWQEAEQPAEPEDVSGKAEGKEQTDGAEKKLRNILITTLPAPPRSRLQIAPMGRWRKKNPTPKTPAEQIVPPLLRKLSLKKKQQKKAQANKT